MRKIMATTIAVIVSVTLLTGIALAYQQYDPIKYKETKGYDPDFLKDSTVLKTCIDSHQDLQKFGMDDLGYCSEDLGTL